MSSVYADVIVDITNEKLDRTFQYKVPPELTGEIGPGTAVQIPFGNGNRTITVSYTHLTLPTSNEV